MYKRMAPAGVARTRRTYRLMLGLLEEHAPDEEAAIDEVTEEARAVGALFDPALLR